MVDVTESTESKPPREYFELGDTELMRRIQEAKDALGERVLILGHHYVPDPVIRFADHRGDSYGLAKQAAAARNARWIVFCGVHFMAESADILTAADQIVVMPDLQAGCPLANFANLDQVSQAWDEIARTTEQVVVPVTYVNSSAALKDFVGRHGGAVCTSSNAAKVVDWAFARGEKLFFFPDQHLGRNTCVGRGMELSRMIVWDPEAQLGGNEAAAIRDAQVILWKGHCHVHQDFLPDHIAFWRSRKPGITVIVHPECTLEVVRAADMAGSTSFIIDKVHGAAPGSQWAIGTEAHLVTRLKAEHPDRFITSLSPTPSTCPNMHRNRPQHLLWVLEQLGKGVVVNRVSVPDAIAEGARIALRRMLEIAG
jgi:quinolinate synthase